MERPARGRRRAPRRHELPGQWRLLPIMANRQPGAAGYLRRPGQTTFVPFVLAVLRLESGRLTGIAAFEQPSMFAAFDLPASL